MVARSFAAEIATPPLPLQWLSPAASGVAVRL
jgi:hypothetical protein